MTTIAQAQYQSKLEAYIWLTAMTGRTEELPDFLDEIKELKKQGAMVSSFLVDNLSRIVERREGVV